MPLDTARARELLKGFNFRALFIDELGWDQHRASLEIAVGEKRLTLSAFAQKRGMVAFHCPTQGEERVPEYSMRRKVEHQVAKTAHEHLIVFTDPSRTMQIWQWVKREPGKPAACREHTFHTSQPGDALLQKLQEIAFTLDEEASLSLIDVTRRARAGFDVERVTKRFYDHFQKEHAAFLKFITGVTDSADHEWYGSVMLNRLMFVYFIQRKRFLAGDRDYLRNRLERCKQEKGKDKFYSFYRYFLLRLFHEGLGGKGRSSDLERLLGRVPYLNGGLFEEHVIEQRYPNIQIPDRAFERVFTYFDQYQWHLDERPLRADNEINPDVLGYIFEKYINQKQMGAYYTKEDISEYISRNTVIPFVIDRARVKCEIAFDNAGGPTVWDLLSQAPDRYVYPSVSHGTDKALPPDIAAGVDGVTERRDWNKPAPADYALPTETWRELGERRRLHAKIRRKLVTGAVRNVDQLITLNLDIRQFAQDVVENCEGPDLLRAFWEAVGGVTVLDPTCGSGAFLFAALNILEPLYEACLDRMEAFIADRDRSGDGERSEKFSDFRNILDRVATHPNRRYFIFKSIILNNLFGVDLMEEAVEICKLRLFLKLAAQVEPDVAKDNLGIEPLPDIDFNVRAGNTLVGYATYDHVKRAVTTKLDFENAAEKIAAKAAALQRTFDAFRQDQTEGDGTVVAERKAELRHQLDGLRAELNRDLADDYGVKVPDKNRYSAWLRGHQPFHWFVEFYGSLRQGGFDVVIGNPPYLEYSKVSRYRVRDYVTERCANLYAFTVERSLTLSSANGRVGMIVPISIACSGAMEPLRNELFRTSRSFWLSHFANRPGQLFTGAQNRLTIFVASPTYPEPKRYSTRYHRWDAKQGERDNLFPTLRYQELALATPIFHGLLPKIGCPEAANVLAKIASPKTIAHLTSRRGKQRVFWVRVPGYFCQFLLEPPLARPERGGAPRVRGEVNDVTFDDKNIRHAVHAVLNSATYYQFFCAYTDTRHINPSDVIEFPLDVSTFSVDTQFKLDQLSAKLAECFTANTSQWRKSGLLIDSIDSKPCKLILDEIDRVLARHYGFSDEELDFIINYDIKHRMGLEVQSDDD